MLIKLFRTLKAGFQNFYRNGWLSVATISIITITLFIINIQLAITVANNFLLQDIKDKVSISVYFNADVSEADVLRVKDEFGKYQEVQSIEYVSKDQALSDFEERNADNEVLRESIRELGDNPFEATLNIKASDPDQYELIARSVEESEFKELISSVNYHKYRNIIDGLSKEVKSNQRNGIILGVTLAFIAVLITFNSIRITMYSYRQEIEIMRLVGASNTYIKLPFVWEGILYGVISATVSIPLSFFYLKFIAGENSSELFLPISNTVYLQKFLADYFLGHIFLMILFQIGLGILLGIISSMIAMRKYLKK